MQPRAEGVGNFLDAQLAARGGDDIEQDLEALRRELRRQLLEAIAADHEEAAHGIGDLDPQHALGHFGGERAGAGALPVEAVGAAAFDVAAADHEIGLAALQQRQHLRQLGLVMLQVGVDHRGAGRAGGQDALDAGAGQAAPPDPPDAADPAILPRQLAHDLPGAVGGIVVDEDDFPGDAGERRLQPPVQLGDVVALVEGGDDDRKLRACAAACGGLSAPGLMASFMPPAYIRQPQAKPSAPVARQQADRPEGMPKTGQNRPQNANDHEQRARVHPAQPSYSVVVPAPEL